MVRRRHQGTSSIPLPHGKHQSATQPLVPLPVWQVGGKTQTEVLGLGWQSLGELGSALPRVLTLALPLTNPGPPWTQSILSLSLSSAVGFPVWLPHPSFTILITDEHYLSNVSMDMSLSDSRRW